MTAAVEYEIKEDARRAASLWLERHAEEREALLRNRRARSTLNGQEGLTEGTFVSEDPEKPWTSIHSNLPQVQNGEAGHVRDVGRQRGVIATLRQREAEGRNAVSAAWQRGSCRQSVASIDNPPQDCLVVHTPDLHGMDNNEVTVPEKQSETLEYDMLMKELQEKREQLSELVLHQESPQGATCTASSDVEDAIFSPVYQACKPSHVKHLGGDLYSKMTPEELDKELTKLRADIATLEERTAAMM